MVINVILDGPNPKWSETPKVGMPTPQELDQRACPVGMGSTTCTASKTIYSSCYAGSTLIGDGIIGLPLLAKSLYHDFFGTLQKIPASVLHAVDRVGENGIGKLTDGQYAQGTFNIIHGVGTLFCLTAGVTAGVKGVGAMAAKGGRASVRVAAQSLTPDAFDLAARSSQFGAFRLPDVILRLLGKGEKVGEKTVEVSPVQKPIPPRLTVTDVQSRLEGLGYKAEPRVESKHLLDAIRSRYPEERIWVDELGIIRVGQSGFFPQFKARPMIIPAGTVEVQGISLPLELRIEAVVESNPIVRIEVATCDYRAGMQSVLDEITLSARQDLGTQLQAKLPEVSVYPSRRTVRYAGARDGSF